MTQYLSGLSVGTQYQVSFEWAAGQSTNHTGSTTVQLEVLFGSDQRLTPLINLPSQGFASWQNETFVFTASSATSWLNFHGNTHLLESVVLPSSTTSIWSPLAPALPLYRNLPRSGLLAVGLVGAFVARLRRSPHCNGRQLIYLRPKFQDGEPQVHRPASFSSCRGRIADNCRTRIPYGIAQTSAKFQSGS
jgi:hypothetical protein